MKHLYFFRDKSNGFIKNVWLMIAFLLLSLQANGQCPPSIPIPTTITATTTTVCQGASVTLEAPLGTNVVSYCNSFFQNADSLHIKDVIYGSIFKSSDANSGIPVDYTSSTVDVYVRTGYILSVDIYSIFTQNVHVYAWIDWNQDGVLDGTDETYEVPKNVGNGRYELPIAPPATALNGKTRMRVMAVYSENVPTSCNNLTYGEAEDYTVNVNGGKDVYTYSWSDGTSVVGSSSSLTVTPTETTTYTLTVTNQNGCSASENITIGVVSAPNAPTVTNGTVTAGATSATLGATNTATGDSVTETIDLGNTIVQGGLNAYVDLNGTISGIPSGAIVTSAKLIFNGVTTGELASVYHFNVSVSGQATTLSETVLANVNSITNGGPYDINLLSLSNGTFTVKIRYNGFLPGSLTINSVKLEYTYTLPVTINWYDVATGGTALATGTTYEVTNTTQLNTAGTYTYYVTADNGTCESERTAVTLTVNPALTMYQPANQEVRHGENTLSVTFTSAEAGVTYDWTNSTTSIGLPASGTGNIPSFVANNTTETAVTATITVTPKKIGMNILDINQANKEMPMASFELGYLAQSFKAVSNSISGAGVDLGVYGGNSTVTIELWDKLPNQTGAIKLATGSLPAIPDSSVDVSWSPVSVTPGTTYYLVFKSTDIHNFLLGDSNTPYIDGQMYTNAGNDSFPNLDFTFRVYKSAGTTIGTPKIFTIKVNPGLTMDQPANQEVRHGDNTEAVTFTSTEVGVTYDWTNNTTSIGLPASGTGNIPSFVANNTTDTAVTATITVTPKIVAESVVDIDQPMADQHISNFDIPLAQSFTAVSNSISGAGIKLSTDGANSTVTVELWDKLPNQTGAIKLATGSSTATPNSWVDVSWSPVLVTPGTTYYLVFNSTDEGNGMMGSFDTYADGQVYAWPEYYSYPFADFAFRVYNSAGTTTLGTPETFTITVNPITLNVSDINKKEIAVYPNPFTEVINLSDINLIESITVNDISGKLIKTIKPTKEINFSNNASGTYIINVRFKDGDTKSFKVIKK